MGYLALLWGFDRHEREPWWAVLLAFASGALCAEAAGWLEAAVHVRWPQSSAVLVNLVGESSATIELHMPVERRGWFQPGRWACRYCPLA